MKRKSQLFLLLSTMLLMAACQKEVVVKECTKRRAVSVKINALPDGVDIFSNPDLRCDISPENSSYWAYLSNSVDNVSGLPVTIYFPNPVLFSEEIWNLRILDEDIGEDETIYISTFDPYAEVTDAGVLPFTLADGTIAFELNFTESE